MCTGVYREIRARLIGNAPWVSLSRNNQIYTSSKLNSYGDRTREVLKKARRVESMLPRITDDVLGSIYTSVFTNRLIGRGGLQTWPPRSPDFTAPDYFLWGHLKISVHETKVDTRPALLRRIFAAAEHIRNHRGLLSYPITTCRLCTVTADAC
jgi:hypothetical protein